VHKAEWILRRECVNDGVADGESGKSIEKDDVTGGRLDETGQMERTGMEADW